MGSWKESTMRRFMAQEAPAEKPEGGNWAWIKGDKMGAMKAEFIHLMKRVNRPGVVELLEWLEDNGFLQPRPPASTTWP